MARITYGKGSYESIGREDVDEGMAYQVGPVAPDRSLAGLRFAMPLGPCAEEPEVVIPLEFLRASGADVDVIAPDWTPAPWLPVARFWTPTIKLPYQKKISQAVASDYRALILIGGTWNPAVLRTDDAVLAFVKGVAKLGRPIFAICHGAQVLISAGLVRGVKVTGSPDIRIDLRNAGADVVETQPVVIGQGSIYVGESAGVIGANFTVVSSRDPNDVEHFCRAIAAHFARG